MAREIHRLKAMIRHDDAAKHALSSALGYEHEDTVTWLASRAGVRRGRCSTRTGMPKDPSPGRHRPTRFCPTQL